MSNINLENETANQHFLSQAEQRLNAINPNAQPENQRIYEFDVVDRDVPVLRLCSPRGRPIARALSWEDLFSFHVAEGARSNLETLFERYEQDIARVSRSLIDKLRKGTTGDDIKAELLDLFAMKFLNFLRNPYSVRKVLNTVGVAANYVPTDPELRRAHDLVREGSKPQREAVCNRFGLTTDIYDCWLTILFNLLMPAAPPRLSLFESLIKALFEGHYVFVRVHLYTLGAGSENVCLLSDRGFNAPIPDGPGEAETGAFGFDFNVSSDAFVSYIFCDPARHRVGRTWPQAADYLRAHVQVSFSADDLDALVRYNQLAIFQCASRVFAAHVQPRLWK